jgi:hypothetical protein
MMLQEKPSLNAVMAPKGSNVTSASRSPPQETTPVQMEVQQVSSQPTTSHFPNSLLGPTTTSLTQTFSVMTTNTSIQLIGKHCQYLHQTQQEISSKTQLEIPSRSQQEIPFQTLLEISSQTQLKISSQIQQEIPSQTQQYCHRIRKDGHPKHLSYRQEAYHHLKPSNACNVPDGHSAPEKNLRKYSPIRNYGHCCFIYHDKS